MRACYASANTAPTNVSPDATSDTWTDASADSTADASADSTADASADSTAQCLTHTGTPRIPAQASPEDIERLRASASLDNPDADEA